MIQTRFGGIARLYGRKQLELLQQARICIIGIGGVGSWVAESLARTGIGHLTLIDLDDICATNINRQVHAQSSTIGQSKVTVMAERIAQINPECNVGCEEDFLTQENLKTLIQDFDYVIDCIDEVKVKAALIAHCKRNKIPVITTGGAGGQIDPSKICFGDVAKTTQDPLLAKVRYILRKQYNFSQNPKRKFGVDCVYSTEQLVYPNSDGTVCHAKSGTDANMNMDCQTGFGSLTMVTGTFAFFISARVVDKYLARCLRNENKGA